jgi:hypothetical protein
LVLLVHEQNAARVAAILNGSALKWAFADFDNVTVGIDEQTLSLRRASWCIGFSRRRHKMANGLR